MNSASPDLRSSFVTLTEVADDIEYLPVEKVRQAQFRIDRSTGEHSALWKGIADKWSDVSEQRNAASIADNIRTIARSWGGQMSALDLCNELKSLTGGMERRDAFLVGEILAKRLVSPDSPNISDTDTSVMQERCQFAERVITTLAA